MHSLFFLEAQEVRVSRSPRYKAVISEAALYGITLSTKSSQLVNQIKKLCLDNIGEKGPQLSVFTLYLILVA